LLSGVFCVIISRMMDKICTFTGNRPIKLPWGYDERDRKCREIKEKLYAEVERAADEGYTRFICGMAQGSDLYFAEAVLTLKKTRRVVLECALPYEGQADKWSEEFRRRHADILDRADLITILSPSYTPYCMHARNRYMVDKSSRIIALNYSDSGGAFKTIEYAKRKGLDVILLDNNDNL